MKKIILLLFLASLVILGFSTEDGRLIISHNSVIRPSAWDDIRVPLERSRGLGAPADADFDVFQGAVRAFSFDPDSDEELFFSIQLPHNYRHTSDLIAHIHWTPTNTNTGDVRWCLEYTLAEFGDAFGGTTTSCVLATGSGTAYEHQMDNIVTIDGSAIDTLSSMIVCRIYRDADHLDDDYNADAFGIEFDFHYEVDDFGSRTVTAK